MIARALWAVAPGRAELREEAVGDPGPGEVAVEALFSGISRGTEHLVLHGQVPPSQHEAMRGPHMGGAFPFPVKYGYAMVGAIESGDGPVGQRVFCLHPHQERFVLPRSAVVPLPTGVPPERAVLAANLETAINAVWDARPGPGDRIAVVGGGVVGCLVAWLAGRLPGAEVTLVDLAPERASVADALGVRFATPEQAPGEQDLVVHTSASEAGLSTALGLAGVEATVLELSWYGDRPVAVPLGEAFHSRRLTLRCSQVGQLPPERRPRWTYRRRLELALRLLRDPALDVLLTGECALEDLPRVLPGLRAGGVLCHRVRYGGAPPCTE